MRNAPNRRLNHGTTQEVESKSPFVRALPSAIAVIPVSMLFGILAHRSDWSIFEVLAASILGFTGSGQFALLPLSDSSTGFLTMLLICASINSRYIPIAYTTQSRLPNGPFLKGFTSHMLGDEAFATEKYTDSVSSVFIIRLTIFLSWVISGIVGSMLSRGIPDAWLSDEIHLGYPASVVLVYLSVVQIKHRAKGVYLNATLAIALCVAVSFIFITFLGPTYFWLPSVFFTGTILNWFKKHE